jgi:hypothetical protein
MLATLPYPGLVVFWRIVATRPEPFWSMRARLF